MYKAKLISIMLLAASNGCPERVTLIPSPWIILNEKEELLSYVTEKGRAGVWDLLSGKLQCSIDLGGPPVQCDIKSDGKRLIAQLQDGRLVSLGIQSLDETRSVRQVRQNLVWKLVPDSPCLISRELLCPSPPRRTRLALCDLETGHVVNYLGPKAGLLGPYIVSVDGKAVLTCDWSLGAGSAQAAVYGIPDNKLLGSWKNAPLLKPSGVFLANRDLLAGITETGQFGVWRPGTGEEILSGGKENADVTVDSVFLDDDGKYLIVVAQLWDGPMPAWVREYQVMGNVPLVGCWVWCVESGSLISAFVVQAINIEGIVGGGRPPGFATGIRSSYGVWLLYYMEYIDPSVVGLVTAFDVVSGRPTLTWRLKDMGSDGVRIDRGDAMRLPEGLRAALRTRKTTGSRKRGE